MLPTSNWFGIAGCDDSTLLVFGSSFFVEQPRSKHAIRIQRMSHFTRHTNDLHREGCFTRDSFVISLTELCVVDKFLILLVEHRLCADEN